MNDRFSVARCCCGFCEDCCNGNAPSEFDVDIEYGDKFCSSCNEDLSGTFTLPRVSGEICRWQFTRQAPSWSTPCVPNYSSYDQDVTFQLLRLDIRCINASDYRITAFTQLAAKYTTGEEILSGTPRQSRNMTRSLNAVYSAVVPFNQFTCDEVVDYELTFAYAAMFATFEVLIFPYEWSSFSFWYLARPPITASQFIPTLPIGSRTYNLPTGFDTYTWTDYPICEPPATIKITGVP